MYNVSTGTRTSSNNHCDKQGWGEYQIYEYECKHEYL